MSTLLRLLLRQISVVNLAFFGLCFCFDVLFQGTQDYEITFIIVRVELVHVFELGLTFLKVSAVDLDVCL